MDRDKDKGRTPKGPPATQTRNGTPSGSQLRLEPYTIINAAISNNPGPVSNTADACKWLDTKG